eukprot:SAG31_NODE_828_length_11716_cov_4.405785_12_plen_43_part_00
MNFCFVLLQLMPRQQSDFLGDSNERPEIPEIRFKSFEKVRPY